MSAPGKTLRIVCGLGLCLGLVAGAPGGAASSGPAEPPVRELELPDLDRRLPGVLDLDSGELRAAPRPGEFANVEAYKAALAARGDLAYEDARGGMLFVASGLLLPLGTTMPDAETLRSLETRLEARSFLRRTEIDPGSWFALRTRAGKLALARVVHRTPRALRLRWSPPWDEGTGVPGTSIRAIAAGGPAQVRSALLPPLVPASKSLGFRPPDAGLRLADRQLTQGPTKIPKDKKELKRLGEIIKKIVKKDPNDIENLDVLAHYYFMTNESWKETQIVEKLHLWCKEKKISDNSATKCNG